jgi:hypothetical protein
VGHCNCESRIRENWRLRNAEWKRVSWWSTVLEHCMRHGVNLKFIELYHRSRAHYSGGRYCDWRGTLDIAVNDATVEMAKMCLTLALAPEELGARSVNHLRA